MELAGKVALVTGGAKRVGRAIVLELARGGCDVVIHYRRSAAEAQDVVAEVEALGRRGATVAGELSDPASWPAIVSEGVRSFGRLDILVNNASIFLTDKPDTLAEFDVATWDNILRTNLTAPVGLCRHAFPHLSAHGVGKIVNLCDISAERPWASHLAYCASKAALVAVTKALAKALAPTVLVNGVSPGIAEFPDSYSQELREKLIAKVPLRRAGTPKDVARVVRFLVESGDYVTGQVVCVDGGRSLA